jgi:hypothetical protein
LLDGPPLPHDIAGGLSWATSIGVYALLPSRLFMDAKTRAWLEWVEARISLQIEADAVYFS